MRLFLSGILFALLLTTAATASGKEPTKLKVQPLINSQITGVAGHKALVERVTIPPKSEIAAHYHLNEEFLAIIKGSAIMRIEGEEDKILSAGMVIVIPARAVHLAVNLTTEPAEAMVFRVHPNGQPVRFEPETKNKAVTPK